MNSPLLHDLSGAHPDWLLLENALRTSSVLLIWLQRYRKRRTGAREGEAGLRIFDEDLLDDTHAHYSAHRSTVSIDYTATRTARL